MINLPQLAQIVAATRQLLTTNALADEPLLKDRTHAAASAEDVAAITAARPYIAITFDGSQSQPPKSVSQPQQLSTDTYTFHIIGSRAANAAEATGGAAVNALMKIRNHLIHLLYGKPLMPRYFATQLVGTSPIVAAGSERIGLAVSFAMPYYFCPSDGYALAEIDLDRVVATGTPANPLNRPATPDNNELTDIASWQQGDYGDNGKATVLQLGGDRNLVVSQFALTGVAPIEAETGDYRIKRTGGGLPTITTNPTSMRVQALNLPPAETLLARWNNGDDDGEAEFQNGMLSISLTTADNAALSTDAISGGGYYRIERRQLSASAPPTVSAEGALAVVAMPNSLPTIRIDIPNFAAIFTPTDDRDNVEWRLYRRTGVDTATIMFFADLPAQLANPYSSAPNFIWTLQRTHLPAHPAVEKPQADIPL